MKLPVNVDRPVGILQDARAQAERMAKMYEDDVIPKILRELTSAKDQFVEHRSRIAEIDTLLGALTNR